MTYIEFFDKNAADNICACLANVPERVVFVGNKAETMKKHGARYESIFVNRGHNVELLYCEVNQNKLDAIVEALASVVEEYDDCVFGLTGGGDLFLVAMGIICERYKTKNIQMHRFNLRNNTIIDCDLDGETIAENALPQMTVEENIRVYGGDVVSSEVKPDGTFAWDLNDEFKQDILDMWGICRKQPSSWNKQIGMFAAMASVGTESEDKLTVTATRKALNNFYENKVKIPYKQWLIRSLIDKKLLLEFGETNGRLHITFKNAQVKRCLTKAGQALEMKIMLTAMNAHDKKGAPIYNDVVNGVYIDWDGDIHPEKGSHDTENEIDVMMMHGIVPVFVSCKNGKIETEELYKLSSVAEKFGGQYSKKVLVTSTLKYSNKDKALRQRARDMNIRIVDNITEKSDPELTRIIKSFWLNS